jgi:acyl-coenzyme A thioesterase PaaI-like protein
MPDYAAYLRRFQAGEKNLNPYLDYFDITIEEVREGYARFRMPVLHEYMQGAGFLQGGLIVALADEAIAHAAMTVLESAFGITTVEFGSERIPRSLLLGKRANDERYCSLRIEDSPQLAAESFH